MKKIYVLVGLVGSGKTAIAQTIERKFGVYFLRIEAISGLFFLKNTIEGKRLVSTDYLNLANTVKEKMSTRQALIFESADFSTGFKELLVKLQGEYEVELIRVTTTLDVAVRQVVEQDSELIEDEVYKLLQRMADELMTFNEYGCLELNNNELNEKQVVDWFQQELLRDMHKSFGAIKNRADEFKDSQANRTYKKISTLLGVHNRKDNFTSELDMQVVSFLFKESLSIMRGVQLTEAERICMFSLLFTNVEQLPFVKGRLKDYLGGIRKEILNFSQSIDMQYRAKINDIALSQTIMEYLNKILIEKMESSVLKEEYNGKPWRIFDKHVTRQVEKELEMPKPNSTTGFIPTLNQKGWNSTTFRDDIYTQQFIEDSSKQKSRSLILGAAYGIRASELLEAGRKFGVKVVVNDLDPRHMQILRQNISVIDQPRLTVVAGNFTEEIDFPESHFDSILVRNVIHGFTIDEVEETFRRLYNWLKPEGKIYVTATTPYLSFFKEFIPTFEAQKSSGENWPGFIEDIRHFMGEAGKSMPEKQCTHTFDPDILKKNLERHGYCVNKVGFFGLHINAQEEKYNSKEFAGVIAHKSNEPSM